MPAPRLTMRKVREILRLRWGLKRTLRETAASCRVASSTDGPREIYPGMRGKMRAGHKPPTIYYFPSRPDLA